MYWRFSISPSKEYSGLISFKIARFGLLAVQRTLKNVLQLHISRYICKAEVHGGEPRSQEFGKLLVWSQHAVAWAGEEWKGRGVSSHSVVPGPAASASPRKLLEMHAPGLYPRTTEWETSSGAAIRVAETIHTVTLYTNMWEPLLSILSISEQHGGGSKCPVDINMFPSRTHVPVTECLLFPR